VGGSADDLSTNDLSTNDLSKGLSTGNVLDTGGSTDLSLEGLSLEGLSLEGLPTEGLSTKDVSIFSHIDFPRFKNVILEIESSILLSIPVSILTMRP
jgi:hypothetical protein